MKSLVVVEIPGLTRRMVEDHAPRLRKLAQSGRFDTLRPDLPAVTMTGHASLCTGLTPQQHGVVGNGWYYRDQNVVRFWEQSEGLIEGERVWESIRRREPKATCFKYFWWPGMGSTADVFGNVRPAYCADGRKLPDIYMNQPGLSDELQARFGTFPLFRFWGPATDISSTRWIADTAQYVIDQRKPTLSLIYLPHLDYKQQSQGPTSDAIPGEIAALDEVAGSLIEHVRDQDGEVLVVSGYHINSVKRPLHLNRLFREQGWLQVISNATGELIDFTMSRAFAVADHQVAHVYVGDDSALNEVAALLKATEGVAEVLDTDGKRIRSLDHARSGELIVLAERDTWFTYYYWDDDDLAPDFARTVAIHDKPGYDPCELFIDPRIRFPKLKIAGKLLRKKLGMRYLMDVIPLDASLVRGSHGLLPANESEAPVFISTFGSPRGEVSMQEVKQEIVDCVCGE